MSPLPRFHVPGAAPGARLELPEHAAHHAREVLRLRSGAAVRVFDGAGAEFEAVLDEVSRRTVSARLGRAVAPRPESPLRLVLAVSPLKGDRMELVVQKATELGVAEIWPVVTFRTDAAARPALHGSRGERWERVASGPPSSAGARSCPTSPRPRPWTASSRGLRRARGRPPRDAGPPAARRAAVDAAAPLLLLVGPAGGFEPAEADASARPASPPPPSARASSAPKPPPWPRSR